MNDSAWDRVTDAIDTNFGLTRHGRLERPLADAPHLTETVQFVEFDRNGASYRLERSTGPAIIDRKTFSSKRIGSDVRHENVYDEHEVAHKIKLMRDSQGEWTEVDPSTLGL